MVTWGVAGERVGRDGGETLDWDGETADPTALVHQLHNRESTDGEQLPRRVDDCYRGSVTELALPAVDAMVTRVDTDADSGTVDSPTTLQEGEYLLTMQARAADSDRESPLGVVDDIRIHVHFDGPASLHSAGITTVLSFQEPTSITVGFVWETNTERPHLQVPATPEGLATAITHLSGAHHTMQPSRSHPELRGHPPIVTTGETTRIPEPVRQNRPETGITLRVPECEAELLVSAPLAYYLGAKVVVESRDAALLTAEGTSVHRSFDAWPSLQAGVAALLRKVFYLDCLVRRVDPAESGPRITSALSLDPDTVRSLSPAGRLERYIEVSDEAVNSILPEWPLSTYVSPEPERVRYLPFLLDRLSLIYLPDSSRLDQDELLDRTLADSYLSRGSAERPPVIEPNLREGQLHSWLAPGNPIDACKTPPEAYVNRYRSQNRDTDSQQVAVVLNDEEMADEHTEVTEIYRAADLPMDVRVSELLSVNELADVFRQPTEFVHFIGHCDEAGLRCPDGNLALSSLSEARTQTFFLNACGSYDEGLDLVKQGAVAGAVTLTDVLDKHAALVGTAFARLLSNGFSIQRALELARRRIMMCKDYAVVGDGTYSIVPNPAHPAVVWLSEGETGFDVQCTVVSPERPGESYRLPFDDSAALNGEQTSHSLGATELADALGQTSLPVIYDGEFHWSDDLAARLRTGF
ncbi:hypothetical protein [Haloarcula marismortui]|uniref:CHAT domain-containing protein n=1 Tax=Haloarcula marismortui ATCC 33800 TaxID=662476 RepID=M0JY80_9EURY|nr:hypothetical protein [Haloarcula sinaiiensis]EMA13433.1 hypothetical protein C436_08706 [Haloarcula sinaiiensis ATCC 33800]QUJ73170.1 hypothetical protein KDQ40_05320 [Haloarcula sinaiiensis ATCC 33800]